MEIFDCSLWHCASLESLPVAVDICILVQMDFLQGLQRSFISPHFCAVQMPCAALAIRFGGKCHTFDLDLVSKLIKLDQGVTAFHTDALQPSAQVLEFKVGASLGALELLVVVIEVDAFVVFKVDLCHFCFSLTLTLHC